MVLYSIAAACSSYLMTHGVSYLVRLRSNWPLARGKYNTKEEMLV